MKTTAFMRRESCLVGDLTGRHSEREGRTRQKLLDWSHIRGRVVIIAAPRLTTLADQTLFHRNAISIKTLNFHCVAHRTLFVHSDIQKTSEVEV